MSKKWQTLSTKEVYDNAWITVKHHEVINPNGGNGIYGLVHFKNQAIGIIPLDEELNTWLVGQYRYALQAYSWEIPMGGARLEESILEGAKRELQEETGLIASKWENIMKIHTSNSVTDEVGYVFLAQNLTRKETNFDDTEDLKIRKLPFQEVLQMVLNQEITDAISVAGILKTARILEKV